MLFLASSKECSMILQRIPHSTPHNPPLEPHPHDNHCPYSNGGCFSDSYKVIFFIFQSANRLLQCDIVNNFFLHYPLKIFFNSKDYYFRVVLDSQQIWEEGAEIPKIPPAPTRLQPPSLSTVSHYSGTFITIDKPAIRIIIIAYILIHFLVNILTSVVYLYSIISYFYFSTNIKMP